MNGDWLHPDFGDNVLTLNVDERVYSVTALLRAAYWFTDRAYIFVSKPNEHSLRVQIKAKPPTLETPSRLSLPDVAGEFGNALLDYQLREVIEERTGKIRGLLVTKALGEANLMRDLPPGSANDSVADQNGIDLGGQDPDV
jgi:His-Xaa-Ser system protein HxsD